MRLRTRSRPPLCRGYLATGRSPRELVLLRMDVERSGVTYEDVLADHTGSEASAEGSGEAGAEGGDADGNSDADRMESIRRAQSHAVDAILLPPRFQLSRHGGSLHRLPEPSDDDDDDDSTSDSSMEFELDGGGGASAAPAVGGTGRAGAGGRDLITRHLQSMQQAHHAHLHGQSSSSSSHQRSPQQSVARRRAMTSASASRARAQRDDSPTSASLSTDGGVGGRVAHGDDRSGAVCEPPADARSLVDAATITIGSHAFATPGVRTVLPPLTMDVCLVSGLTFVTPDGVERRLDESLRLQSDPGVDVASTLPPRQPRYVIGASSRCPTPPLHFPWDRRARTHDAVCGPLGLDGPPTDVGPDAPMSRWCRTPADPSLVRLDRPAGVSELRMTLLRSTRVVAGEQPFLYGIPDWDESLVHDDEVE